ncbi:PD-(D/E)XK nuclease family protein [Thiorhodovibrio frisius]|uniref:DUF3782 domain-containing protein n=1 Tax=Thiorhodovibrio frisius TaxID=631362 RepID=H8Z0J2_9GAMM|nr:DUF3782 domain-containing protein [Thiorhodovibrio frisius]EIC21293.1 hypothetical protein containing a coiled-coil domain [Thiorhodovibrio frisius]
MGETMQETIRRTLPELVRSDSGFRDEILNITQSVYANRGDTESRFDRVLAELQRDREEQTRKWEEQVKARESDREEQARKWEEQVKARESDREEQNRKWEAQVKERESDREEQARKWEEQVKARESDREGQNRKWEEQNRKWDQQMAENHNLLEEIRRSRVRQEQSLGAMGARWGLSSEQSFRGALRGILEEIFGVDVININDFDDSGMVFGAPDQVEIDVIIKNGEVILCELKSSMSKGDMYIFDRKAAFYAQRHQRAVTRKLAISPMVRPNARAVAEKLGIEVFSDAEDATNQLAS